MDDLIQFLRARLDEDETTARIAGPHLVAWGTFLRHGTLAYTSVVSQNGDMWVADGKTVEPVGTTVIFDQARALAEVEAKRQIVKGVETTLNLDRAMNPQLNGADPMTYSVLLRAEYQTARLLAQPYAGHAEFREEWTA